MTAPASAARRERPVNLLVKAYAERRLVNNGWTPPGNCRQALLDFPELETNYESIYLWMYKDRRPVIGKSIPSFPGKTKHTRRSW
jgi:hypothetical protein